MRFPGFNEVDVAVFNGAMEAVIRHMIRHQSRLAPAEIAERFVSAIKSGERDPQRLKALTLGLDAIDTSQPN